MTAAHDARPVPEQASSLRIALLSCLYPAGLLDRGQRPADPPGRVGGPEADLAPGERALWHLACRPPSERPDLLLWCGDQVYLDPTAGLADPRSNDDALRQAEDALLDNRGFQALRALGGVVQLAMLDDHELRDNWTGAAADLDDTELALRVRAHLRRNPRSARQATDRLDWVRGQPLHLERRVHGFPLFMMNTRTERSLRSLQNVASAQILGERQWADLEAWLQRLPPDRPALLLSPSLLLPRRLSSRPGGASVLRSEAWDGYPASLQRLLLGLHGLHRRRLDEGSRLPPLIFLSGDEHLSCASTVSLRREDDTDMPPLILHSLHASGLYTPFPVANSQPRDFAAPEDAFELIDPAQAGKALQVAVSSRFAPPGDAYGLIDLTAWPAGADGGGARSWQLHFSVHQPARGGQLPWTWQARLDG